jgi:predicted alpha/beta hydrolase family esterase
MTVADSPRFLILPGWLGSDASHWQSRWEARQGFRRVEQDDWVWPRRGDWMARLEEVLLESEQPAVLIAHSLGCHLVAAWAAHTQGPARVRAALLVAVPDVEREDMPPNLFSWRPIERRRLPFRNVAVVSSDDPYCAPARAASLLHDWGSDLFDVGARGHVNGKSGLGDWPQGLQLLDGLCS